MEASPYFTWTSTMLVYMRRGAASGGSSAMYFRATTALDAAFEAYWETEAQRLASRSFAGAREPGWHGLLPLRRPATTPPGCRLGNN